MQQYLLKVCLMCRLEALNNKNNPKSQKNAEGHLLLILLDVTDIVAAHRARPHVTDECKELILWTKKRNRVFNYKY